MIQNKHRAEFCKIFPNPPQQQPAVGNDSDRYLEELSNLVPDLNVGNFPSLLPRIELREICQDPNQNQLIVYALIMAWGGQRMNHYRASIQDHPRSNLIFLIDYLRTSIDSRSTAFATTRDYCTKIPGLGISYYTKLLYFLRPKPNSYILDQYTAKSSALIFDHIKINNQGMPDPQTTGTDYNQFCENIETFARELGGEWNPDLVEQAFFGKGTQWRNYLGTFFPKTSTEPSKKRSNKYAGVHWDFGLEPDKKASKLPTANAPQVPPSPPAFDPPPAADFEYRHQKPTIYLNWKPSSYIGLRENQTGGPNIGYISKGRGPRGGEICVYSMLAELLRRLNADVTIAEGAMQHGGPKPQHVGNISMPKGQKNPKSAIEFLSRWFNIQEQ